MEPVRTVSPLVDLIVETLRSARLAHVFQPIWDLRDGAVLGFEALARFPGGEPPDLVWAAAREAGDLWLALDRLSIREAVRQAQILPGVLFVNASGRYLGALKPPRGTVTRAVARYRPGPGVVVVEVTEDAVTGLRQAREGAERLRQFDIPVALDDAGTGCANQLRLTLLRPYLAYVKLDRSVVRTWLDEDGHHLDDWVGWAARHQLPVVAEGIEDLAAIPRLREAGVRYGQGFVLGRPEPAEVWVSRLAAARPSTLIGLRGQRG